METVHAQNGDSHVADAVEETEDDLPDQSQSATISVKILLVHDKAESCSSQFFPTAIMNLAEAGIQYRDMSELDIPNPPPQV